MPIPPEGLVAFCLPGCFRRAWTPRPNLLPPQAPEKGVQIGTARRSVEQEHAGILRRGEGAGEADGLLLGERTAEENHAFAPGPFRARQSDAEAQEREQDSSDGSMRHNKSSHSG